MRPLAPFAAVVFDMDGTLLDTEMLFKQIVWEVSGELGFDMTDDVHGQIVGASHDATRTILQDTYGPDFSYDAFNEACGRLWQGRSDQPVPVKPGVPELLAELRQRGIQMAVATSSRRASAMANLDLAGILALFETVVTRDDVRYPKPHPEPYLTAAKRLGREPADCLAIEDSHAGVRSAHAAGLQTVMVPDLVQPSAEVRALCRVMTSLHDVRLAAFTA
ncbi:MAG: HAD family phosphatase [Devosia sp.]